MSEQQHPRYYQILAILTVLTVLEIGVVFMGFGFFITALILVGLAGWKAVLVGRHYMHLKFDAKLLSIVAITPVILFMFLLMGTMADSTVFP